MGGPDIWLGCHWVEGAHQEGNIKKRPGETGGYAVVFVKGKRHLPDPLGKVSGVEKMKAITFGG